MATPEPGLVLCSLLPSNVPLNEKKSGFALPQAKPTVAILCFINTICLRSLSRSPCQYTSPSHHGSLTSCTEKPIIINLPSTPCAWKRQKLPARLSSAKKHSFKATSSWHSLGICPSLWTVNESGTDDISQYETPVMAPLYCGLQYQLYLIHDSWWWKCY